jgi:hypothetical protein
MLSEIRQRSKTVTNPYTTTGDLLTPDEKLLHAPRWQPVYPLRTSLEMMLIRTGMATQESLESEAVQLYLDELELFIKVTHADR